MKWIQDYQLFLFDFDGTLVDTEPFHYEAYLRASAWHKIDFDLSYLDFFRLAHRNAHGWKEAVLRKNPWIDWDLFYLEKKRAYLEILKVRP